MRQDLALPAAWDGDLWHYRNLGRTHARHRHAELEFNLITRGTAAYLVGSRRRQIRRGDLLWLFPAQEHLLLEQSLDFEMWIGVGKPRLVRRFATDAGMRVLRQANPAGDYCRRLAQPALDRLVALLGEVASTRGRPAVFNAGLAHALAMAWCHFEHAAEIPFQDLHPAVENAARLIRDGSSHVGLEALARRCGLSGTRLSRLFKQQTGVALADFRNRQRVERFLRLYGAGRRQRMVDVALEAGFGSYPQFHRVFKRVLGCSPARYRRKLE